MTEHSGNFLKISQGTFESYKEFVGRLQDVLKLKVKDQDMKSVLKRPWIITMQMVNVNQFCFL